MSREVTAEDGRVTTTARWVRRARSARVEWWFALGLCFVYLAFLKGHLDSVDGLLMFRQGASLTRGSVHLAPAVEWNGTIADSKYGIGQSLLYVPFIAIGRLFGLHPASGATQPLRQYYADVLWTWSCSWINCVITAATAFFVGTLVRALGGRRRQIILGMLAFGIASPALTYSSSSFAQPLCGLTYVVAVLCLVRRDEVAARKDWLLAGAIVTCILCRPIEGVLLGGIAAAYLWWVRAPRRELAWPVLALVGGIGADLLVNTLRFGSPLETGYGGETWKPTIDGLLGLSVSPGRGILWYMPFCVLAPWGFMRLRRSGWARPAWLMTIVIAIAFLNAALWDMWWGGVDWGPRLLLPAVPLLAVLGASAVTTDRRATIARLSVVLGFLLTIPTVVVDLLAVPSNATHENFRLDTLPFLGSWSGLHRLVALGATDQSGVDILWFRMVRPGGVLVLLVPIVLLTSAVGCFVAGVRSARRSDAAGDAEEAPRPGASTPTARTVVPV